MISETYVEHLVARKTPFFMRFLKTLLIMFTACFVLIGLTFMNALALLLAVVAGVASYFVFGQGNQCR